MGNYPRNISVDNERRLNEKTLLRLMGECEFGIVIGKRGGEFFENLFSDTVSQGVNFLRTDNLKLHVSFSIRPFSTSQQNKEVDRFL